MRNNNLKALATVASSPIRTAITLSLNDDLSTFSVLQRAVIKMLGLPYLTDSTFVWHLNKLELANVIQKSASNQYELTSIGRQIDGIIRKTKLFMTTSGVAH